jgi:hypothetical protein
MNMELMYLTVDYDKRTTTHHVGPLADHDIKEFKKLGHEIIVIEGEGLQIIQDPENLPTPEEIMSAEEEAHLASTFGFKAILDNRRGNRLCYFIKPGISVWKRDDNYWCNARCDEKTGLHSDHKYTKRLIWALEMER